MDGGDGLYRLLLDRFVSLEASHHNLKQQFEVVLQEKTSNNEEDEVTSDSVDLGSFPGWKSVPGAYFSGSPYRNVLEYMGHAVHVSRARSGEIIYWNSAAEKLYGYKDCEVVGERVVELLFDEEHQPSAQAIMARLSIGESWSGQLPLKKRSGQRFMAMVTKTPMYEDGELVGIVTVSSDAAVFNFTNSGNMKRAHHQDQESKVGGINFKKIPWHPKPQIAAVPQIASSVSNLASKVLLRKHRENEGAEIESPDVKANRPPRAPTGNPAFSSSIGRSRTETMSSEKEESTSESAEPSNIAVNFLSKLQIGAISKLEKVVDENIQHGWVHESTRKDEAYGTFFHRDSIQSTSHICNHMDMHVNPSFSNVPNIKFADSDDVSPRQSDSHKIPGSGESVSSGHGSSSSSDNTHVIVDYDIHWEDLQLKEEIGQGAFAVVYRGIWNGSDVAVKVYSGNQYNEQTLVDYKKEIDIMRRLRHPNVLLFMGAACTEEKLAMVTEYLTRGSLFKTLHRNKQSLDIRRRLKMAIDVARGMNYLHHRNPPIVHRDLKSSNLLVDKSWTVKVGDFGLSKLKNATFLTARSGRGTPQWMAPEVLRNEPSTEKSDVFSFGVILWELMTESVPWSDLNCLQVVGVVGFMDQRLELPDNIDPQVSSIIRDCWRSKPEDRPSFEDILHTMTDLVQAKVSCC